jgi:hypothetical protein
VIDIGVIGENSQHKVNNLCSATEFYLNLLLNEDIINDLTIDIEIDPELNLSGECYPMEEDPNPRHFVIRLNPETSSESIYATLAHELVHVKQFATGEMYDYISFDGQKLQVVKSWKGKTWEPEENQCSYYDSPWEIEAFGREVGMYHKWKNRKAIISGD